MQPAARETGYVRQAETRRRNRQAILDAAVRVFAQVGYDGAKIRDIIAESKLSPGTFYNHFRSKTEVFDRVMGSILRTLYERTGRVRQRASTPFEFLQGNINALLETFTEDEHLLQLVSRNQAMFRSARAGNQADIYYKRNEKFLRKAMEDGLLPRTNITYLNLTLFGMAWEILAHLSTQESYDIRKISREMADMILNGIGSVGEQSTDI